MAPRHTGEGEQQPPAAAASPAPPRGGSQLQTDPLVSAPTSPPRGRGEGAGIGLSEAQLKALRAAVTTLSMFVVVFAVVGLLRLLADFLGHFSHVFLPIAVAGILALVLSPYFELLRRRLRIPTPLAVLVVILTLVLPIVGFFWFFGSLAVNQVSDLVHRLPTWWGQLQQAVQQRLPQVMRFLADNPLGQKLRAAAEGQAGMVATGLEAVGSKALSAGAVVLHWVAALINWAVLPIYFIFFLVAERSASREWEVHVLPFLKPETREDVVYLGSEFLRLVVTFFRGQLIVAAAQAVLYAAGFTVVGLRYGFILGLALGFLNLVPYLGSIVGLSLALPLAFFQDGGGGWLVGAVLAVFTIVHVLEGYVITPRVMGGRTGLHPVVVIVAIFFWGTAFNGILGMILAIPLTAFLVVAWELAKEKYIREWI